MKICIISDTHNNHKQFGNLKEADIIIHCGDITSVGKEHEIRNFLKWFSNLSQFKYKIFIAGNHDWLFERGGIFARKLVPNNIIYLEDNGTEIEGIKIWGSPVQPHFNSWAFNRSEEKLAQHWKAIPNDTNILITHCPPYGVFDISVYDNTHTGSPSLYYEILERIKPNISMFGHIHSGRGMKKINNILFINASNLDEEYQLVNPPIYLEIIDNQIIILEEN